MKRSRAYNVESTLRWEQLLSKKEARSSIIICAYICIVLLYLCVYVKYCIFHKYTFNLFHIIFDIYITLH